MTAYTQHVEVACDIEIDTFPGGSFTDADDDVQVSLPALPSDAVVTAVRVKFHNADGTKAAQWASYCDNTIFGGSFTRADGSAGYLPDADGFVEVRATAPAGLTGTVFRASPTQGRTGGSPGNHVTYDLYVVERDYTSSIVVTPPPPPPDTSAPNHHGPSFFSQALFSDALALQPSLHLDLGATQVYSLGSTYDHMSIGPFVLGSTSHSQLLKSNTTTLVTATTDVLAGPYDEFFLAFDSDRTPSAVLTADGLDVLYDAWGTDLFVALVHTDPRVTPDPLGAEVLGPVYARSVMNPSVTAGVLSNDDPLFWVGLGPGTVIAGLAIFDAPVNGDLLWVHLYDTPLQLPLGGSYLVPPHKFSIRQP